MYFETAADESSGPMPRHDVAMHFAPVWLVISIDACVMRHVVCLNPIVVVIYETK